MADMKLTVTVAALAAVFMPSQAGAADLDRASKQQIECGGYASVAVGVADGAAGARVARFSNFSLPHQFRADFGPHYRVTFYDPDLNCGSKHKKRSRKKY